MSEREYLDLLIQSLKKKLRILNQLSALNQEQRSILQDDNALPDAFEANVQEKEEFVKQLTALDEGFDEVYARVKDLMEKNHSAYEDQLEKMRELVRQIMAKDASVRAEEQRNYELAQRKFSGVRKKVREVRANQKMVNTYYKNMMKQSRFSPQYMDRKK